MAEKRIGLKNTLGLSPKIELKPTEIDLEKTQQAVKDIHSPKEETRRVTIDMPLELFKAMKRKIVGEQTARDYILGLVKEDLHKY